MSLDPPPIVIRPLMFQGTMGTLKHKQGITDNEHHPKEICASTN